MTMFYEGHDPLDATYGRSIKLPIPQEETRTLPVPEATIADVPRAALRQYNPIMWAIDAYMRPRPDAMPQPGYDPIPLISGTRYAAYMDQFLGDVNPAQTQATMAKIDRDLQDQGSLAASHAYGTAAIVVAIAANPLWLLVIWVALRLWKQQAASVSARADLISMEVKKDSFWLLIFVIVSLRKAWRITILKLRLAYGRVRDAVHNAENTR
jgi:hypothetical protein